jgi:HAD superfamily hydrolase (TIGR01549 family)
MKQIEAVTLDLDDTLWPIEPVIRAAEQALHDWLRENCPRVAQRYDVQGLRAARMAFARRLPELSHDLTALRCRFLRELLEQDGYDPDLADTAFEVFMRVRNQVALFPDALPALERLAGSFPLASVSNGNADLSRIGLDHLFAARVSARDVGAAKPHPDVFLAACEAMGCPPHRVVHIGDHPDQDILGALGAGLRAIWVNRCNSGWLHAQRAHAEVSSLEEVPALLCIDS